MSNLHLTILFLVVILASIVIALAFGRSTERQGALVVFASTALTISVQGVTGAAVPLNQVTLIDSCVTVSLLALFVRSGRLWIGIAGCFQTLVLAFDLSRYIGYPLTSSQFLIASNLVWAGVCLSLAGGACARRWGGEDPLATVLSGHISGPVSRAI